MHHPDHKEISYYTLCLFASAYLFTEHIMYSRLEAMQHTPVLAAAVVAHLATDATRAVYDGTMGFGGHAQLLLETYPKIARYIGTDLDAEHLAAAGEYLAPYGDRVVLHHTGFDSIAEIITGATPSPRAYFFDLGICSHHVDNEHKGFSYQSDGPLDMRLDQSRGLTAAAWIASVSEEALAEALWRYGELRQSRPLARAVRAGEPQTTAQLRQIVEASTHPKERHKAVKCVFQALRIQVNDELGRLERTLQWLEQHLGVGDRVGVITFHSLEDRLVKQTFKRWSTPVTTATDYDLHTVLQPARGSLLTRHALAPTADEIAENPRSRSAKLRVFCCETPPLL